MTYRSHTEAELAERKLLMDAIESATKNLAEWEERSAILRSSLQVGDTAYDLDTGMPVGEITQLIKGGYYEWREPENWLRARSCDNNSRTYGKPSLGTKQEAAEHLELSAQTALWLAQRLKESP